ncbi:MAG: acetylglutamate kinase [Gaiellales bacterium]
MSGALVAKLGGNALALLPDAIAAADGRPLVLVHGGGAQITALMERRGIPARWVDGRRFTDLPTLACARVALAGVSDDLVAELRGLGRDAQPFRDGELLTCRRRADLGLVGEPAQVDVAPIAAAWNADRLPLIAPIGRDGASPRLLNVNADDVAAAVAVALEADELAFLSDVPGVLDDAGNVLPSISAAAPPQVSGGMLPKLAACSAALAGGVGRVRVGAGTEVRA